MDHDADVLPAGMVELYKEFRSVAVDAPCHLPHGLDVIVVRHRELIERGCTVIIVDPRDLGDDEPRTALGALFVIIH